VVVMVLVHHHQVRVFHLLHPLPCMVMEAVTRVTQVMAAGFLNLCILSNLQSPTSQCTRHLFLEWNELTKEMQGK
jgi:hypothetical protein